MTVADVLNNHSDLIEKLILSVAIFAFCLISMCLDNGKHGGIGDVVDNANKIDYGYAIKKPQRVRDWIVVNRQER